MTTAATRLILSRRTLCSAAALFLFASKSKAVEPLTYLQAAAAVVGIVAGLSGMKSDSELRKQMRAINAKLDIVIANQMQILGEIQALRLYIDAAFEISWRNAYARRIQSYSDQLNDLAAETHLNDRVREEYDGLRVDANLTTNEIGQMDIAAFPFFAVGVAVTLYCMIMVRMPRERVRATSKTFAEKLSRWLDPANPRSIAMLIKSTEDEIASRRKLLDARGRQAVIGQSRVSAGSRCTELHTRYVHADGNFEAGYTARYSETRSDKECREPPDLPRCNPRVCLLLTDLPEGYGVMGAASINGVSVPPFNPSGNDFVDSFNRDRIAIFQLMYTLEQQRVLMKQMLDLRSTLVAA